MKYTNANRVFQAIYREGNADKSKTLRGWQTRCQPVRKAILQLKREHQERIADLQKTYVSEVAYQMAQEEWNDTQAVIDNRAGELLADLQEIISSKREQYAKVGLSAPTDEQIRLLQALSMRDDLSEGEVASIAAKMSDNFQAMRSLKSIAKKSGVEVVAPPTTEAFEDSLSRAEKYCCDMLRLVDADEEKLGYGGKCFYNYTDVGIPHALFNELDRCLFAAVQVQPMEVDAGEPATAS